MLFWARWPHTGEIMLLLILPLPVYLYYQAKSDWRDFARQLRAPGGCSPTSCLTALSWAGSKEFDGHGYSATVGISSALR